MGCLGLIKTFIGLDKMVIGGDKMVEQLALIIDRMAIGFVGLSLKPEIPTLNPMGSFFVGALGFYTAYMLTRAPTQRLHDCKGCLRTHVCLLSRLCGRLHKNIARRFFQLELRNAKSIIV